MNVLTYHLKGLDCAHCAAKIQDAVGNVENVSSAELNLATQRLSVNAGLSIKREFILEKVKDIVGKIEPDVQVIELETGARRSVQAYRLKGLDCAHCSAKIQDAVGKVEGVGTAELNFATQKLSLTLDSAADMEYIRERIIDIVGKLEPDVQVVELEEGKKTIPEEEEKVLWHRDAALVGGSLILLLAGVFLELPFWVETLLFTAGYLMAGGDVVLKALRNAFKGYLFDENFLMAIATIGAFAIQEYPEAVSVMIFYKIGELFQEIALNNSRKSIKALVGIRPDYANLKTAEGLMQVDPYDVVVDDVIVVRPGERVPLDGTVVEGFSTLDTSAVTGESVPRAVGEGDEILSGFVNINGVLNIKVTKSFGQSTISRIIELVQNATGKKAAAENFITKFARYYTPAVVVLALWVAVLPPLITGSMDFKQWIYRALIFLVVSCPCALVISIPLGFFGGIGGASRRGILIKGSNFLEALNNVGTVAFDKTGTLTKGVFKVTEIAPANGFSKEEVLEYAAMAEAHSGHPIAKSIRAAYGKDIDAAAISSYEEVTGRGIKTVIGDKEILAGNSCFMPFNTEEQLNGFCGDGSVVYLSVNGQYAGCITISDELKEDAVRTVAYLKEQGVDRVVMLTGDNAAAANKVAAELKVDQVYSGLLPQDKFEKLEMLIKENGNKKLVFVGDGINDAPVLARADIGIAMGGLGSDAAIEASDIVLMTDEPSKLAEAIKIARKTRNVVWQNIIFAMGVKAIVLALGTLGMAAMWEAVFADVGVALIAVLNAMRVMKSSG